MRLGWIVVVNLVVPGAGLIVLRRAWLGFAVALLFCVSSEIGLLGWLLIPATVPRWVSVAALAGGASVWGWSQWLLVRRYRISCGVAADRELRLLGRRSDEAIAANKLSEAHDLLLAALTINDEHVETNLRWAQLLTRMGHHREASKAWQRVVQLDRSPERRREATRALVLLAAR